MNNNPDTNATNVRFELTAYHNQGSTVLTIHDSVNGPPSFNVFAQNHAASARIKNVNCLQITIGSNYSRRELASTFKAIALAIEQIQENEENPIIDK